MFELVDRNGNHLGCVQVTKQDGHVLEGTLRETSVAVHGGLFAEWQQAVDEQRLNDVDRLDRCIADLAIAAEDSRTGSLKATSDLQIWPDGQVSFRLGQSLERDKSHVA